MSFCYFGASSFAVDDGTMSDDSTGTPVLAFATEPDVGTVSGSTVMVTLVSAFVVGEDGF